MSVKVRLHIAVEGNEGKFTGCMMERLIEMPFPPTAGLEIGGIYPEGADTWDDQIKSVMWDHERQEYIAWLCPENNDEEPLQEILDRNYGGLWTKSEY